ncbi:hypothetical protein GCM10020358_44460 [Amorphoplanes nipponensis]|uniref:Uncharacterized protein n=1 Tax=Actinoplanes nipponensis TaxID=135950 RepID=A0A919JGT6_9ACTN|nr:hypothetical protein [Actinoplanes nipponensis]GIE49035.1 hypothetical protein Ani05nite_25690 [Actinoplanes nipponensis]
MTIVPEELAQQAARFAAAHEMTVVPAIPEATGGLVADIDPAAMTLDAFLALAGRFGGGLLYLRLRRVRDGLPPSPEFARHAGEAGAVELAFVANGVLHCWEQVTDWFDEWEGRSLEQRGQEIADALRRDVAGPAPDDSGQDREDQRAYEEYQAMTEHQRDEVIDGVVGLLLADPEFRAAKGDGQRHTIAKRVVRSAGVNRWLHSAARNAAVLTAAARAGEHHDVITGRLDELAAQVRDGEGYRAAASAAGRRRAVETFLQELADGYWIPGDIREEVYARTVRLGRTG